MMIPTTSEYYFILFLFNNNLTINRVARTTIADKKEIKEGLQFVASGFLIKLEEIISESEDNKEVKQEVKQEKKQEMKQEPIVSSTGEFFIDNTEKISK